MLRSYRGILIALAGIAALVWAFSSGLTFGALNYPQQERYQSYRYASDKPLEIEPAPVGKANSESFEYRYPCSQPKGKDESGLCAEWKAADAAADAAWWAQWGMWLAVVQIILSFFGTVFVVKSLHQVEAGLEHSHAADAAHFIVRDAMVKRGSRWCVPIDNHGQTIGFALGYTIEAVENLPNIKKWRADEGGFVPMVSPLKADGELMDAASVANVSATARHIIGKIDYVDVFGVRHLSGFRYDRAGKTWRVHRINDWCFMRRKTNQSAAGA